MKMRWKIVLIVSLMGNLGIIYVGWKALEYRSHINEFLEKYTYVVAEFSGRNRFEEANKALSPDSSSKGRVVFMGSQITARWDLSRYFPEYQAVNRGISGQRLAGFLLRIVPDVVELRPRAVVVEFSSYNFRPENSVKEICDYIASFGDIASANGVQPVFTTVVPVRNDFHLDDIGDYSVPDSLEAYNRWLRSFCRAHEYPMVDFYELLADDEGNLSKDLSAGQILLNDRGYGIVSEATRRILGKLGE
jgi:lysophospholipase L1-like esterase